MAVIRIQDTGNGYSAVTIPGNLARTLMPGTSAILDKEAGAWLIENREIEALIAWCTRHGHVIAKTDLTHQQPEPFDQLDLGNPPDPSITERGAAAARAALKTSREEQPPWPIPESESASTSRESESEPTGSTLTTQTPTSRDKPSPSSTAGSSLRQMLEGKSG
jgi:hypothetical protein